MLQGGTSPGPRLQEEIIVAMQAIVGLVRGAGEACGLPEIRAVHKRQWDEHRFQRHVPAYWAGLRSLVVEPMQAAMEARAAAAGEGSAAEVVARAVEAA